MLILFDIIVDFTDRDKETIKKVLNCFIASITVTIEPVVAIIFGILIFNDRLESIILIVLHDKAI